MNSGQLAAQRQVLHSLIFLLRDQGGGLPSLLCEVLKEMSGNETATAGLGAQELQGYEEELGKTIDFLQQLADRQRQEQPKS